MKGIPEGYEFVRVGRAMAGETIIATSGNPLIIVKDSVSRNCVVVRRVRANCEFPRGMFKDGWLTYDSAKGACWWSSQPKWAPESRQWVGNFCASKWGSRTTPS